MIIRKTGIPSVLPDNDTAYLSHIIKCIAIIDDDAELVISKSISGYGFTLRHSDDSLKDILIKQIKAAHELIGLDMEFSSFKHSPYITFRLLSLAR